MLINFKRLLAYFDRNYTLLGAGRHRAVFEAPLGHEVIKVPSNAEGDWANVREGRRDDTWLGDPARYARTYVDDELSRRWGLTIIRMERVNTVVVIKDLPDWCGAVDGFQVGYTASGNLVAYDWG